MPLTEMCFEGCTFDRYESGGRMTELAATVDFCSVQVSVMIKAKEDGRDECMISRLAFGTY